jgi:hypothetical protein
MSKIRNIQNGTIFIVDISGFTRFVKETESIKGALVISRLLTAIVSANKFSFEVSEIEGDAILFFRYGKPSPVSQVLDQFETMLSAFNKKLKNLKISSGSAEQLSIKAVAHYGEISRYRIFNFDKLYGKVLIEAHRLLKNQIHQDTYMLITDQYFDAAADEDHLSLSGFQQCEKYDVGKLCYRYFPYIGIQQGYSRLALVS